MPEAHKQAEIDSRTPEFMQAEASKPFGWGYDTWVKWATVEYAMGQLAIQPRGSVLDVGCGSGWASLFLASAGYAVTAVDIVPANVELARERAGRWGVEAEVRVADMDSLDLGRTFDFVLVYDALHHSVRQPDVVAGVARHLAPGG